MTRRKRKVEELEELDEPTAKAGDRVSLDVPWPNGRSTRMEGTLLTIRNGEAYIETNIGPVVGQLDSLELIEASEQGEKK